MKGSPQEETELCLSCGHTEDDHDGYGGLCDGFGYNDLRQVCPCISFIKGDSTSLPLAPKETPELEKMLIEHERLCMEDLRKAFVAVDASRAIEPVTARILAHRKLILESSPIAPTADFKERET